MKYVNHYNRYIASLYFFSLQISVPLSELRDLAATYNPYSLQRLQTLWPDVSIRINLLMCDHLDFPLV